MKKYTKLYFDARLIDKAIDAGYFTSKDIRYKNEFYQTLNIINKLILNHVIKQLESEYGLNLIGNINRDQRSKINIILAYQLVSRQPERIGADMYKVIVRYLKASHTEMMSKDSVCRSAFGLSESFFEETSLIYNRLKDIYHEATSMHNSLIKTYFGDMPTDQEQISHSAFRRRFCFVGIDAYRYLNSLPISICLSKIPKSTMIDFFSFVRGQQEIDYYIDYIFMQLHYLKISFIEWKKLYDFALKHKHLKKEIEDVTNSIY